MERSTHKDVATAVSAAAGSVKPMKVDNQHGSGAAASSGSFHVYRRHKRKELQRLEAMEAEFVASEEKKAFELRNKCAEEALDAKTKRNRAKRQRQKARKQKLRKKPKVQGESLDAEIEESESGTSAKMDVERDDTVIIEDNSQNNDARKLLPFKNDGSFLEGVKAMEEAFPNQKSATGK